MYFIVFYTGENPNWAEYVVRMSDRWKYHVCGWLLNGRNNPIHIVKFEDMQNDVLLEMSKIILFFGGTKMSEQDIASRIKAGYNQFYRNHTDTFNHFTPNQENYVINTIKETIDTLSTHYGPNSLVSKVLKSYVIM